MRGPPLEGCVSLMAFINWQDSYSVGVEVIDSDHKLLMSLLNQLHEAVELGQSEDVLGSVLNVLVEYVETHFAREEALMQKANYPDLAQHRVEHAKLAQAVRDRRERYQAEGAAALDAELLDFLRKWLSDHILGSDMRIKPFVRNMTLGPADLLAFGRE